MAAETVYPFTFNLLPTLLYCKYYIFLFSDNHIKNQEIKTDRNRDSGNTKQTSRDSLIADYIDNILVISTGSLLSFSLLLLIGREIVKLRRPKLNNTSEGKTDLEFHRILFKERRSM